MTIVRRLSCDEQIADLNNRAKHYVVYGTWDDSTPGKLVCDLWMIGSSPSARVAHTEEIEELLRLAAIRSAPGASGPWVTLESRVRTSASVFYSVTGGTLVPRGPLYNDGCVQQAHLELDCLPVTRGEPYDEPIAGTLVNGAGSFLIPDVPGTREALVKLALPTTGISRVRVGRRARRGIALTDFNPWIATTVLSGAIDTGSGIQRTVSGSAAAALARIVAPSGELYRGTFDCYGRVTAQGTAVGQPTGLAGVPTIAKPSAPSTTVNPDTPTVTSKTTTTPSSTLSIGQVKTALGSASAASVNTSITWASAQAGSLWVAFVGSHGPVEGASLTVPAGWTLVHGDSDLAVAQHLWILVRENAPASSAPQAFTTGGFSTGSRTIAVAAYEIRGVPATGTIDALTFTSGLSASTLGASASNVDMLALTAFQSSDTGSVYNIWFGGYTERYDTAGFTSASKLLSDAGQTTATGIDATSGASYTGALVIVSPTYATSTTTTSSPSSSPPGKLVPGTYALRIQAVNGDDIISPPSDPTPAAVTVTNSSIDASWPAVTGADHYRALVTLNGATYQIDTIGSGTSLTITDLGTATRVSGVPTAVAIDARVQARDAGGFLSDASATATAAAAWLKESGGVTFSWSAPTGAPLLMSYLLTVKIGTKYYAVPTGSTATSFTLTSIDGAKPVTGFPSVSGAIAPAPRIVPMLGTANSVLGVEHELDEVIPETQGAAVDVLLWSGRDCPPAGQLLDGSRPDWAAEFAIISANGLDATVTIDDVWIVAHDEPQLTVEVPGLEATTPTDWIVETDLRGASTNGWRQDGGVDAGQLSAPGAFTLAPGENLVQLLVAGTGGVVDDVGEITGAVATITPGYGWQRA